VWEAMVTSNGLVSCLISPDEKLLPSMNSIGIGVFFSTKANVYYCISSLSIKQVDVLESKSVQASIVTSLIHLIMIDTKKYGVRFEDRLRPFSLHDASRSSFKVCIETGHVRFPTPLVVD